MLFVKFYVKTTNPLIAFAQCTKLFTDQLLELNWVILYKIHRSWETTTLTRRFLPVRRATWRSRPPPSQLPEQLRPVDPAQWADDKFLRENNVYFIFAENNIGKIMNFGKERWSRCWVNRVEKIVVGALNFGRSIWRIFQKGFFEFICNYLVLGSGIFWEKDFPRRIF